MEEMMAISVDPYRSQRLHLRGRDLGPEDPTGSFKGKCRSALGYVGKMENKTLQE